MIGVDEVGRGCLAGPLLVVAARQIDELPHGLADSKLLTRRERENFIPALLKACVFGEGWVSSIEIDTKGLAAGIKLGIKRAFKTLDVKTNDEIIYDGPVNYVQKKFKRVQCIIDADALVPLVSAASIFAKVRRDKYMIQLAQSFPDYGFDHHVGYGTKDHKYALQKLGPLRNIHRMSFRPLQFIQQLEDV